jgi:hypothetical protein
MCVFIEVNAHTFISIYVCTVFLKKQVHVSEFRYAPEKKVVNFKF